MAWGYEKAFIVEHVDFKKKLSCKDCCYYEKDDKSCLKRPLYLPEDGYNSWKNCKCFEPTTDAMKNKHKQSINYVKYHFMLLGDNVLGVLRLRYG